MVWIRAGMGELEALCVPMGDLTENRSSMLCL